MTRSVARNVAGVGALVLGLLSASVPTPARAAVVRDGFISNFCSGKCVDVWEINCRLIATHAVGATVQDLGDPITNIRATAVGFTNSLSLLQGVDIQIGGAKASLFAGVPRTSFTHGPSKMLMMVTADGPPSSYRIRFFCVDAPGEEIGDPVVTLLQDQ